MLMCWSATAPTNASSSASFREHLEYGREGMGETQGLAVEEWQRLELNKCIIVRVWLSFKLPYSQLYFDTLNYVCLRRGTF